MVIVYHNPVCGTSRTVVADLRARGIEPRIVEYLKTPLDRAELQNLIARMGVAVRDVVRWKEKETVAAAGITETSGDDALLAAMAAHPILMNRPIVITDRGAKLCRPAEMLAAIL